MTLPEDFEITLAAAEPDIVRPISFTLDARGRLWVVEAHTYPVPAAEGKGKDRILIFEDTDGNGTLDKRKVFTEGLNLVSGIEIGMGGVWLGAAPYLLYIPVNAETDKPAGPPRNSWTGGALMIRMRSSITSDGVRMVGFTGYTVFLHIPRWGNRERRMKIASNSMQGSGGTTLPNSSLKYLLKDPAIHGELTSMIMDIHLSPYV